MLLVWRKIIWMKGKNLPKNREIFLLNVGDVISMGGKKESFRLDIKKE